MDQSSVPFSALCGVPHGPVLGPILGPKWCTSWISGINSGTDDCRPYMVYLMDQSTVPFSALCGVTHGPVLGPILGPMWCTSWTSPRSILFLSYTADMSCLIESHDLHDTQLIYLKMRR